MSTFLLLATLFSVQTPTLG
uniref:Uncharacterized protein n=1 Tax=Rhizophora mucronata TaxID=61149 RepID=A0A2P2IXX8_RHIMU